jgi:hypothetical protein
LHAGVADKAIDGDVSAQLFPSVIIYQVLNNTLKGNSMQRIVAMISAHKFEIIYTANVITFVVFIN